VLEFFDLVVELGLQLLDHCFAGAGNPEIGPT
jgi:hypothetical protein